MNYKDSYLSEFVKEVTTVEVYFGTPKKNRMNTEIFKSPKLYGTENFIPHIQAKTFFENYDYPEKTNDNFYYSNKIDTLAEHVICEMALLSEENILSLLKVFRGYYFQLQYGSKILNKYFGLLEKEAGAHLKFEDEFFDLFKISESKSWLIDKNDTKNAEAVLDSVFLIHADEILHNKIDALLHVVRTSVNVLGGTDQFCLKIDLPFLTGGEPNSNGLIDR